MYNNPYWASWAAPYINQQFLPQPVPQIPQYVQPQQQSQQIQQQSAVQQPQQPVVTGTWNWKVTDTYQSMLMEAVPFDGTPVLFMMKSESTFYVVSMVDGKKMINGFSFVPLGNTAETLLEKPLTPEEQTEKRFSSLESTLENIQTQLSKLTEVKDNEPNSKSSEKTKSTRQQSST